MIDFIVFSKDRTAQLDLLLSSIKLFFPTWNDIDSDRTKCLLNIGIIYKSSTPDFQKGYDLLINKHANFATFLNQENRKLSDCVNNISVELHRLAEWTNSVCFSTDDMVFYKPLPYLPDDCLPKTEHEVFSFRLGFNTIEQDIHRGTKQPPLNVYHLENGILSWNPQFYYPHHNYGYPLAIDTHIFHRHLFNKFISKWNYNSSNELEGKLQQLIPKIGRLSSFKESIAVNIPVNNLSGLTIAGQKYNYSPEFLNEQFLLGKVINLYKIVATPIIGCHQEIEYEFI